MSVDTEDTQVLRRPRKTLRYFGKTLWYFAGAVVAVFFGLLAVGLVQQLLPAEVTISECRLGGYLISIPDEDAAWGSLKGSVELPPELEAQLEDGPGTVTGRLEGNVFRATNGSFSGEHELEIGSLTQAELSCSLN